MLRQKLDEITNEDDVNKHVQLLRELSEESENTIQVLRSAHQVSRYTCMVYIFDFVEDEYYESIATYFQIIQVIAGTEFVTYLIDKEGLTEISLNQIEGDDIVIYSKDGNITHGGKITEDKRVNSKWGIGNLYNHEVLEVPLKYGSDIRYFKTIDKEIAMDYFVEYAKEKGVVFE